MADLATWPPVAHGLTNEDFAFEFLILD